MSTILTTDRQKMMSSWPVLDQVDNFRMAAQGVLSLEHDLDMENWVLIHNDTMSKAACSWKTFTRAETVHSIARFSWERASRKSIFLTSRTVPECLRPDACAPADG